VVEPDTESPHAATWLTAQTRLAATAVRQAAPIDASPLTLVVAASAGGGMTYRDLLLSVTTGTISAW
jgi:hypothetical protein